MTAPVCTIIEAAEMAALGTTLLQLWCITVVALLVGNVDFGLWEWRVRRFLRHRRMQRIRSRRAVLS